MPYKETSGSAPVYVYYDALDREIRKETFGLGGKKISVFTEYQSDGKVLRVSEPSFDSSPTVWAASYSYDDYGRVTTVTTPMGTTNTVVSGAGGKTTTTISKKSKAQEVLDETITQTNGVGQVIRNSVNGKVVTYTYFPSGLTESSTPVGGQPLKMEYNLQGKRTKLTDPDAGVTSSIYNAFGELTSETDAKKITTINSYDANGLLLKIDRNGEVTNYTYDAYNHVSTISIANKNTQSFSYDGLDRVTNVKEDIYNGTVKKSYAHPKTYDYFGRVKREYYPSGYYVTNEYDDYGNLIEIKDYSERSIWKAGTENALGQALTVFKGNNRTEFDYDTDSHLKTRINTTGIVDYSYGYDLRNNLMWRGDNRTLQNEDFKYDTQNRLTRWSVTKNHGDSTVNSIQYNVQGNIDKKSDLGDYQLKYGEATAIAGANPTPGPHALTSIAGKPDAIALDRLDVTYTDFGKIASLHEGIKDYMITYGVDDQRRFSINKINGVTSQTHYYAGDYEEEIDATGNVRKIHYLSGAILIRNKGIDSLLYTYSDNQGSLLALVDESGTVVRRYAYDPWGNRRDVEDWTKKDNGQMLIVNRGYTGHEHLDAFGIINMNGRVYDPATAMFFSPDPYVQAPGEWLNYNRYGYCMGNPLKFTDPSGEAFGIDDAIFIGMIMYSAYTGGRAMNNGQVNPTKWDWNSGNTYLGVVGGGIIGAASYGLGSELLDAGAPMTLNLIYTSTFNSLGMNAVTLGKTPVSTSFGFGSYNWTSGELGYIGKDGNSFIENLGYAMGGFGNISDAWGLYKGVYNSENSASVKDADLASAPGATSHASLVEHGTANNLLSVGTKNYQGAFNDSELSFNWNNYVNNGASIQTIKNVNLDALRAFNRQLIKDLSTKYQLFTKNCAVYASRGLLNAGVFVIPQTLPRLLQFQIFVRNYSQYSYNLTN